MTSRISIRIKILVGLLAILMSFWLSFVVWTYLQDKRLSIEELDHQALGIYHYIVLSRRWIAKQAGIFIKKGEDSYALLTPSGFTEALAEYSKTIMPFSIKLSVKDSSNPLLRPNEFEEQSILQFKGLGVSHSWTIEEGPNGKREFLFVAPLYFTNECNSCHAKGDSKVNRSILGSISVRLPVEQLLEQIRHRFMVNLGLFLVTLMLAIGFLWAMLKRLVLVPLDSLQEVSKRVGSGDLKARVHIGVSPEWEAVAKSFNKMVEAMEEQNIRLERAVKEAVAQLERANSELKRAYAYKSTFFSNVSHDLKTPITAIKGASEILASRLKDQDKLSQYVDIISRNVQKLNKMVHDLLICARLESGPSDLNFEENDLREVLEDCVLMLMPIAWDKEVKLEYHFPEGPILVKSDRSMLDQLFTNLISNAIKFSPKGGIVEIGLYSSENRCKIVIEDSGPGIPSEDWERVFQKFYRSRASSTEEGMGLGLAISKFIVEAHRGEISLGRSQKLGGTRVEVTLKQQPRGDGNASRGKDPSSGRRS